MFTFALANRPDGGIGRRAGLKHQWGNPSRFEPGSGYIKTADAHSSVSRFFVSIYVLLKMIM